MCHRTSFAILDGDGEGCVVCNGSRLDCTICPTTAFVLANNGFCWLVMSVSSVVAPTTLHVSMSSLCVMDRMVILMSSCRMGEGFEMHE